MSGNADYQPTPGYEDRMHFIGPVRAPIWIGKKREVADLITEEFWYYFQAWRMFNVGLGLPDPGLWPDQDPTLVDVIAGFQEIYRVHFSAEAEMLQGVGVIIGGLKQAVHLLGVIARKRR